LSENRNGIFFDILRGSIHDGPGIRTTVFFKGCPLRCIWCHNPESWIAEPQLFFNAEKCVNCLACMKVCPTGAHKTIENRHAVRFELCMACGKCVDACNNDALRIIGYKMDVDSVFEEIKKDMDFYNISGGGVTLSGGEPLMQMAVSFDLLKKCRGNGIHTCVETCGYLQKQNYEAILPFVDTFLFDYKITGSLNHKSYTGADNELILENLDFLHAHGSQIILRCPIIPGINDTEEHFRGIVDISSKYPGIRGVEILPYHNLGISKRAGLGLPVKLEDLKTVTKEKELEWRKILNDFGLCHSKEL
jgi:glycyl-radical enzyme activating protein